MCKPLRSLGIDCQPGGPILWNQFLGSLAFYKFGLCPLLLFHSDKKEKKIFLIYKEIQNGAVAKSYTRYVTNGLLIYGTYIRKPFLISDFATAPLSISLYMRKI